MNNITCTSCHKKFDNDKYYGICPKCGAFNNLHFGGNDAHGRLHEMYDDKNAHSDYAEHEQLHETYDDKSVHSDYAEHEQLHETYDNKNAHSDYAKHEQFHKKYDNTTDHAKVSTAGMSGSSIYSEELNKSKKAKINIGNQTREGEKKKGASTLRWFILMIVIANLVPAIIRWLMAFISMF